MSGSRNAQEGYGDGLRSVAFCRSDRVDISRQNRPGERAVASASKVWANTYLQIPYLLKRKFAQRSSGTLELWVVFRGEPKMQKDS